MNKKNPAEIGNSKYTQGIFNMKNPSKYIGTNMPLYRSSWEKDLMFTCDENPAVIQWAAEPFPIKYLNPVTQTIKEYWPDFLICVMKRDGSIQRSIIEIKPEKESVLEKARSKRDKLNLLINKAKWEAAQAFCNANDLIFQVLTERQLYQIGKKK